MPYDDLVLFLRTEKKKKTVKTNIWVYAYTHAHTDMHTHGGAGIIGVYIAFE